LASQETVEEVHQKPRTSETTNTNTATSAPVQNVYVNTQEIAREKPTKPVPVENRRPAIQAVAHNVRFLKSEQVSIRMPNPEKKIFVEQAGALPALVARFRNSAIPARRVDSFTWVRAHIVYFDEGGHELFDVPTACWIGHDYEHIEMEVGHTQSVIVAIWDVGTRRLTVPFLKRQKSSDPLEWGELIELEGKVLPKDAKVAKVQLIGEHGLSIEPVEIELGQ
jgi:hypothetical protein